MISWQAQNSPQDGSGGTAAAAGASAAVANYLRVLPAEIAAAIVNNLADRLGTVPDLYRDALAQASRRVIRRIPRFSGQDSS